MMKRWSALLLTLLFLAASGACAENRPQGSVNLLTGKTVLVSLYLQEEGEDWTREEMRYTRRAMALATEYLTAAARAAGAEAQLVWDESDLRYPLEYDGAARDADRDDNRFYDRVMQRAVKAVSAQALMERYGTDSLGYIAFVHAAGTSYSLCYYAGDADSYDEVCVLYLTDADLPGQYESVPVYAHELLHLFGAIDLYEPFAEDGVTRELVRYVERNLPDELMLTTYEPDDSISHTGISQTLSDITLYSVGLIADTPLLSQFPTIRRSQPGAFGTNEITTEEEEAPSGPSWYEQTLESR